MAAPSRAPGTSSVVDDVVLWAIGGVAVGAAAAWGGAQLATLVRHGRPLPIGAGTAAQAMFRLPSNAAHPALAWPEPVCPLVPGAPLYWAATALVAVVVVAVAAAAWHLLRNQRVGTERRHRLGVDTRAHLARPADLRPLIVAGPSSGPAHPGAGGKPARGHRAARPDPPCPSPRATGRPLGRGGHRPDALRQDGQHDLRGPRVAGPRHLSSVKDDLLAATLGRRADLGEVKVFDPTGTTGQPCARWSPLRGATTPTGAQKAARMLAGSTRRSGREDVEFFNDLASQLLWALLWTAAVSGRSMRDVVRWVLTRDRPTQKVRGDLAGVLDLQLAGDDTQRRLWAGDAFCALEGVWTCDPRTMSNIYVTAQRILGVWQDPGVVAATDGCDIELDWLVKGNNTLYVCAPLHEQARLSVLFGGLLSDLVEQQAYEWAATHRDPLPDLLVVLDEAANTPTRWLPNVASTCSGLGILLVTIWQSKAQIDEAYGTLADSVLTNHGSKVIFSGVSDPSTLDYVTKLLGEEEVCQRALSTDLLHGGRSVNESTTRLRLLSGDLLRQVPPDHALLIHQTLPPAHLRARPYYANRRLRALSGNQFPPAPDSGSDREQASA